MFRSSVWDPALIVAQMAALQCLLYLSAGLFLAFFALTFGSRIALRDLLAPSQMQMEQSSGWPPIAAFLLVAPVMGYLLLPVVGRAKQCLDFSLTLYGMHAIICTCYHAFPRNWEWWLVNSIACIVCVVIGEYVCLQKELEAIPTSSEETRERERERDRRREAQELANARAAARRDSLMGDASAYESESLIGGEGVTERGIATTTIRLAPNNVFNV